MQRRSSCRQQTARGDRGRAGVDGEVNGSGWVGGEGMAGEGKARFARDGSQETARSFGGGE